MRGGLNRSLSPSIILSYTACVRYIHTHQRQTLSAIQWLKYAFYYRSQLFSTMPLPSKLAMYMRQCACPCSVQPNGCLVRLRHAGTSRCFECEGATTDSGCNCHCPSCESWRRFIRVDENDNRIFYAHDSGSDSSSEAELRAHVLAVNRIPSSTEGLRCVPCDPMSLLRLQQQDAQQQSAQKSEGTGLVDMEDSDDEYVLDHEPAGSSSDTAEVLAARRAEHRTPLLFSPCCMLMAL